MQVYSEFSRFSSSRLGVLVVGTLAALTLACDGGGGGGGGNGLSGSVNVGGTVNGLLGTLVLANNGGDDLTVRADGSFQFATGVAAGSAYAVTVKTQPFEQTCTVASGSGVASSASATAVAVTCQDSAPGYSVGGSVTGLTGTLVLQNNGADDLTLTAAGPFRFVTRLAASKAYAVTVKSQPVGQACSVQLGSGIIGTANVRNVGVSCTSASYIITDRGITVEAPSMVKAAIHVARTHDKAPVAGLKVEDFEVLEDGVKVTRSESFLDLAPFGKIPSTLKTVLMLDVSSSLTLANVETVKTTARNLVADPTTQASRLLPGQEVAIYTFDDQVIQRAAFTSNVSTLLTAIDGITRGGPSTNLYGAIVDGMGLWSDAYTLNQITNGAMILITDGNDTASVHTKQEAIMARGSKQLFAIPVGSEVVIANFNEIAGADHVYPASDFSQLQQVMAKVVDQMARYSEGMYFLYYASPKRSGTHSISISLLGNQNTGPGSTVTGTFNATGFTSVVPEIVRLGPVVVREGAPVQWEISTRWSHDLPNYTLTVSTASPFATATKTALSADGTRQLATVQTAGTRFGATTITIRDLNHNKTLDVGITTGPALSPVVGISAGANHTCATLENGTARCWGYNANGQLGNGTSTSASQPVIVANLGGGASVGTGDNHSCAALTDGTVRCWGYNAFGQLGNGTTTSSNVPVAVSGLTTVTSVSVGPSHSCARLSDGTVRCWGSNAYGQLGTGTADSGSSSPVAVSGLTGVASVSAGGTHTCAVLTDGTARCWGYNGYGQLGTGSSTSYILTPAAVSGLTGAASVSAGGTHTCAVLTDGTARCWGRNNYGQLGSGSSSNTPVAVSGLIGATSVSASANHTCAALADGTARCWGDNTYGQLGTGSSSSSNTPVAVSGLTGVRSVDTGTSHTCAALTDGTARCWGYNNSGQLGGTTTTSQYELVSPSF